MFNNLIKILANELEGMVGKEISTDELLMSVYKNKITDKELIRFARHINDEFEMWLAFRLTQEAKEIGIKLDFSKYKDAAIPFHHIPFVVKKGRKRNAKFDNKIGEIKEIHYWCGGFFNPSDAIKFKFDGEKVLRLEIPLGNDESRIEEMIECGYIECEILEISKKEFLDEFQKLNIGMWAKNYSDPTILDGTQWNLEITYKDGKTRKYWGSNDFPRTFDNLSKLVGDESFEDEE